MLDPLRTQRIGRFQDLTRGQGVIEGYQDAIREDPIDKEFIQRNLKRYQKFGVPSRLAKLKGMSDTALEGMAARAVLKRRKVDFDPLRESINRKRYAPRVIARGRSILADPNASAEQLRKPIVRHIRTIRRARRVNNVNIWSGKGYDIWKGYT